MGGLFSSYEPEPMRPPIPYSLQAGPKPRQNAMDTMGNMDPMGIFDPFLSKCSCKSGKKPTSGFMVEIYKYNKSVLVESQRFDLQNVETTPGSKDSVIVVQSMKDFMVGSPTESVRIYIKHAPGYAFNGTRARNVNYHLEKVIIPAQFSLQVYICVDGTNDDKTDLANIVSELIGGRLNMTLVTKKMSRDLAKGEFTIETC